MRRDVRLRIEMAARARDFSRSNPSEDPSHANYLARLEEDLARADVLAAQERGSRIAEQWAAARRAQLRNTMHFQTLRHLVRIGEQVAREQPELGGKFQLPDINATNKTFLVGTRQMLVDCVANKPAFLSKGLSVPMLEELTTSVDQFDDATEIGHAGRTGHVAACADLQAVSMELLATVELFNIFNSHRFRDDPARSAGWDSARLIPTPRRRKPAAPPAQETGEVTPAA